MSDPLYDKLPRHLHPNLAENNISRPKALAAIMKVFAQGFEAGLEGIDRTALMHAVDVAYNDNKAYAEAYHSGYNSALQGIPLDKAVLKYID